MKTYYRTVGDTPTVADGKKFEGYAAVYGQTATIREMGQTFKERIAPTAFDKSLRKNDIHGLINHDRNLVLGFNRSGTLQLDSDKKGLHFSIEPPDTSYARDLKALIERGDVSKCSFGFGAFKESWKDNIRSLDEIDAFDVSIVSVMPGYPGTSVALRFMEDDDEDNPLQIHKLKARMWASLIGGK